MTPRNEHERIERVVKAKCTPASNWYKDQPVMPDDFIYKLLRRELAKERARVRRIVKKNMEAYVSNVMFSRGYRRACNDLLAALGMRKGTR